MKFLVFGSLNIDHVYKVRHLVREGETVSSLTYDTLPGGKGLNQAVALSRAGQEVWFAGAVGKDGEPLIHLLRGEGVHTELIRHLPCANGHAIIQVDEEGRNSIIVCGGANQGITPEIIDETLAPFGAGDWLLMQNEISCGADLLQKAAEKGMTVAVNPSPITEDLLTWPLEKATYLIVNETEGRLLSGETDEDKIPGALLNRYPSCRVLLTLGEKGAVYADKTARLFQQALPVKAVDTTAAGDTFTGYFLCSLAKGQSAAQALFSAAAASSIAVGRPGATPSIPKREEVKATLTQFAHAQ